jgi:hypothetical protein
MGIGVAFFFTPYLMREKTMLTRIEVLPDRKVVHKSLQLRVLRRQPAIEG